MTRGVGSSGGHGHLRQECEHGIVIQQCRCMALTPKPVEVIRPCPFGIEHLGLTVVHPLPPDEAVGEGLGQVPAQPAQPAQDGLGGPGGATGTPADLLAYLTAIKRYAGDEEFRARVKAIEELIVASEGGGPTQETRVGMWIGAAVALHMAEYGIG